MNIIVDEPLSPRAARWVLVGCLLAIILIVVGVEYLRPHLDRWSELTNSRQQAMEQKQSEPTRVASEDYKRDIGEAEKPEPKVVPVKR